MTPNGLDDPLVMQIDRLHQGGDVIEVFTCARPDRVAGRRWVHSPTAFFLGVAFFAVVFFAGFFLDAGSALGSFLAAATDALRASIRSTTLAVGSASTTSISSPLILA